jgi:hypothetical protein
MTPELIPPPSWAPAFPPMAAFGGAPIYSAGGEGLLVSIMNAAAGVTVTVTGRTLALGESKPSPFSASIIPATDRSVSTRIIPIPDGWLLSAQAIVSGGTPLTGQTFVKLSLVHGVTGTPPELWTLAADYVTTKQALSYPGAGIIDPTDTAGALRSITGTTPGAGAEISETVPTGARWELIAFFASFQTSAVVANRIPSFTIDDGAALYYRGGFITNQAASSTIRYQLHQGGAAAVLDNANDQIRNVPVNNRLGAGHRIRTVTGAIDVGDQWSLVQYLVREWMEGN